MYDEIYADPKLADRELGAALNANRNFKLLRDRKRKMRTISREPTVLVNPSFEAKEDGKTLPRCPTVVLSDNSSSQSFPSGTEVEAGDDSAKHRQKTRRIASLKLTAVQPSMPPTTLAPAASTASSVASATISAISSSTSSSSSSTQANSSVSSMSMPPPSTLPNPSAFFFSSSSAHAVSDHPANPYEAAVFDKRIWRLIEDIPKAMSQAFVMSKTLLSASQAIGQGPRLQQSDSGDPHEDMRTDATPPLSQSSS